MISPFLSIYVQFAAPFASRRLLSNNKVFIVVAGKKYIFARYVSVSAPRIPNKWQHSSQETEAEGVFVEVLIKQRKYPQDVT